MRMEAEKMGIPPENIFMAYAGFSTYESMYRAKEIFQVKSAIIVTQKFHLPRSLYIARKMGIDARGSIADRREYMQADYHETRETFGRIKDFMFVNFLKPKLTFLGSVILIDDDGRTTHDL